MSDTPTDHTDFPSAHLSPRVDDFSAPSISHRVASHPVIWNQARAPSIFSTSHSAGFHTLPPRPGQRHSQDRTQLGVTMDWDREVTPQMLPPRPHPRAVSQNPTPSATPPPSMTRSRTLEGGPLPHNDSYGQLPLTLSPLLHPAQLGPEQEIYRGWSPSFSTQSAPGLDQRRTEDRAGRGNRSNISKRNGPPKAKLGGPGGKTFDEMLAAGQVRERRVSPSPSVTPISEGSMPPLKTAKGKEILVNIPGAATVLPGPVDKGATGKPSPTDIRDPSSDTRPLTHSKLGHASSNTLDQGGSTVRQPKSYKGKEIVVSVPKLTTLVSDHIETGSQMITTPRNPEDDSMWKHDSYRELGSSTRGTHSAESASDTVPDSGETKITARKEESSDSSHRSKNRDTANLVKTTRKLSRLADPLGLSEQSTKLGQIHFGIPGSIDSSHSAAESKPWTAPTVSSLAGFASLPERPASAIRDQKDPPRRQLRIRGQAEERRNGAEAIPVITAAPGAGGIIGKRTISAAGIGSNTFLRKSLGGLFKDKDPLRARKSLSMEEPNTDDSTEANQSKLVDRECHTQANTRTENEQLIALNDVFVDSSTANFEDVSLTTPEESKGASAASDRELNDATIRLDPVTITPRVSRRLASELHEPPGGRVQLLADELHHQTGVPTLDETLFDTANPTSEIQHDSDAQQEAMRNDDASIPDRVLSSALSMRTASTSSADSISPSKEVIVRVDPAAVHTAITSPSPRPVSSTAHPIDTETRTPSSAGHLRPSAPSFVPASETFASLTTPMTVLVSGTTRTVSSPEPPTSSGLTEERRSSLGADETQAQKRVKLRPSAAAFVPQPNPPPRRPAPVVPVVSSGPRIVSDSFVFDPKLWIQPQGVTPGRPGPFFGQAQTPPPSNYQNPLGYGRPPVYRPLDLTASRLRPSPNNLVGPQIYRDQASPRLSSVGWDSSEGQQVGDEPNPGDLLSEAEERPPFHERPNPLRRPQNSHRAIETPRLGSPQLSPAQVTILPSLPLPIRPVLSPDILRSPENTTRAFQVNTVTSSKVHDTFPSDQADEVRPTVTSPARQRHGSDASTACKSPLVPPGLTPLAPSARPPGLPLPPIIRANLPSVPEPPLVEPIGEDTHGFLQPEIKVDVAADDRRFREWTFPHGERGRRPSISRRHTMPTDVPESVYRPVGIASTFSDRVQDLRHLLARNSLDERQGGEGIRSDADDRGASTRSSIEFPLRQDKKPLAVVNATPQILLSPNVAPTVESPGPIDVPDKMELVLQALSRLETSFSSVTPDPSLSTETAMTIEKIYDEFGKMLSNISASRDEMRTAVDAINSLDISERVAEILESQTVLLSSFHQKSDDHGQAVQRTKEMFEAMLTGQHALLNKIAESLKDQEEIGKLSHILGQIRSTQEEIASGMVEAQTSYGQLETIRSEFQALSDKIGRLEAENRSQVEHLSLKNAELSRVREASEDAESRLEQSRSREQESRNHVATLMSARLAAEAERDVLAEALRASMADTERLDREKESLQRELSDEREKSATARDDQVDFSGLSTAAAAFHEELLTRMARLDEGMHETMGSRVKEYEAVLDRKNVMQTELDQLREQLERETTSFTSLKLNHETQRSKFALEMAEMTLKLDHEAQARAAADSKVEKLEKQLGKARTDRETALLVASERSSWVRMMEVRHQALSQENVYWRQFALESDRRKYNAYIATDPFQSASANSPPDAQLQTPAADTVHDAAHKETPTRMGGLGLALMDDRVDDLANGAGGGHVKPVSSDEDGTWWNVA